MTNNRQRLMAANALLYFGPLLAGLGGFGWRVVPVFVGLFLLWLVILRPHELPRARAEWLQSETLVALATRAMVQVLLVVLCFGIGRGIGGVLGALPHFPLMLPIALSFLAIPLARMIWDPWHVGPVEQLLDPQEPIAPETSAALTQRIIQPLLNLPPQTPLAALDAHLAALSQHLTAQDVHKALLPKVNDDNNVARNALILLSTTPVSAKALQGSGALSDAYAAAIHDPQALYLWATATASLLAAVPAARAECPPAPVLVAQAAKVAEPAAAALIAVAAQLDHVA